MASKNRIDRILAWLLIIGLIALAYIGGSAALYFKGPFAPTLVDAFNSASIWYDTYSRQREEGTADIQAGGDLDESIIANAKSTVDQTRSVKGYTLVSTGFSTSAWLVDMNGTVVYRWDLPFNKIFPNPTHTHPMAKAHIFIDYAHAYPNGDLLVQYSALGDTPYGYGIAKVDKHGSVIWTYPENAHHGFSIDAEGNIWGLIHNFTKDPIPGLESLPYPLLVDYIVKLSPEGKELERISVLDAFRDSPFSLLLYHAKDDGLALWDYFHTNSIEKLEPAWADKFPTFKPGSLLICMRAISTVAVIDPDTHKVVWAYDGHWKLPHAAHFVSNGHIMLIDNEGHVENKKKYSRVIEFDPATLQTKWSYYNIKDGFHSSIIGRLQRLSNGNTLIAESMQSRILEITPDGQTVWTYKLQQIPRGDPTKNAIVTATRYTEEELPFMRH